MKPNATVDTLLSQLQSQLGVRVVYRSLCTAEGDSLEKETKLATLNTSTFYLKRDPSAIDITVHLPPGLFPHPFSFFFVPRIVFVLYLSFLVLDFLIAFLFALSFLGTFKQLMQ